MSKKIGLAPKTGYEKKKEERKKQQAERNEYVTSMADKVMTAIEEAFTNEERKPVGFEMIDIMSLASVFVLARQIGVACKDVKTMQSVMKSTMWAMTMQMNAFAEPLIKKAEPWDDMVPKDEEGGDNGRTES